MLAIAATLVLVFHEDIDREFGPGPARRPWSAQELEAWLPREYEEQARTVAGQRSTVVGVRCESRESLPSFALPRDLDFPAIEVDAFSCEVRAVTGQAEYTKHLCGLNGVRNRDGRGETAPTLFEGECPEDS